MYVEWQIPYCMCNCWKQNITMTEKTLDWACTLKYFGTWDFAHPAVINDTVSGVKSPMKHLVLMEVRHPAGDVSGKGQSAWGKKHSCHSLWVLCISHIWVFFMIDFFVLERSSSPFEGLTPNMTVPAEVLLSKTHFVFHLILLSYLWNKKKERHKVLHLISSKPLLDHDLQLPGVSINFTKS